MNILQGLRIIASLGVVLALLALAAKAAQSRGFGGVSRRTSAPVAVLARQGLAKNSSVVVVKTADRALVLGVTDHTISLLAEVDPSAMEPTAPEPARTPVLVGAPADGPTRTPSWRDAIDAMRDRTVRK